MKNFILTLFALLLSLSAFSQEGKSISGGTDSYSGYVNITELNFGFGLGETDAPYAKHCIGITNISTYQMTFKKGFMAKHILQTGLGLGYYGYNEGGLMPVFLDFRFIWSTKTVEPYLFAQGGMLLDFEDIGSDSRLFVTPGIGGRYTISEHIILNLGAALTVQAPAGSHSARDSFVSFKLGMTYRP